MHIAYISLCSTPDKILDKITLVSGEMTFGDLIGYQGSRLQNSRFFSQNRLRVEYEQRSRARASNAHWACEARGRLSPVSLSVFSFCLTVRAYLNLRKNTDCSVVYQES